jgi:hypothetical protein
MCLFMQTQIGLAIRVKLLLPRGSTVLRLYLTYFCLYLLKALFLTADIIQHRERIQGEANVDNLSSTVEFSFLCGRRSSADPLNFFTELYLLTCKLEHFIIFLKRFFLNLVYNRSFFQRFEDFHMAPFYLCLRTGSILFYLIYV